MNKNVVDYFFRCLISKISMHLDCWEYLYLLIITALVLYVVFNHKKIERQRICRTSIVLCFVVYILILFQSLVFDRGVISEQSYLIACFDSYKKILSGDISATVEVILNILLFVPFAFGCITSAQIILKREIKYYRVFIFALTISLCIELCQLIFRKGFFEIDDITNNTIGCMFGCYLYEKIKNKGECV